MTDTTRTMNIPPNKLRAVELCLIGTDLPEPHNTVTDKPQWTVAYVWGHVLHLCCINGELSWPDEVVVLTGLTVQFGVLSC